MLNLDPWQAWKEQICRVVRNTIPVEELSARVRKYHYFRSGIFELVIYTIARPLTITTSDELLATLKDGRYWFREPFKLEATPRFTYVNLTPMKGGWFDEAFIGIDSVIDEGRLFLCVPRNTWVEKVCDWDEVAKKLAATINPAQP